MLPPEVAENRSMQRQWEIERMANGRSALFREGLCEQYDLPYLQDGDPRHTLDLIRPERAEGKLPVILEIHGGGYIACEKNINRLHSRAYAQMGFAVVNGDYTLHPEGDFLTDLWELAAIVNWVADAAEENGFDLNQVYMSGDSAGGHLVLLYAMLQGSPAMAERLGILPGRIRLQAVAATCPAFRLSGEGPAGAAIRSFVGLMYPEGVSEEYLEQFDVLRLVKESEYPPLIVITTPDDELLYAEDLELENALQERGRPYAFRVYESRENRLGHVFNVLYPEFAESEEANRDIAAFFLQHG